MQQKRIFRGFVMYEVFQQCSAEFRFYSHENTRLYGKKYEQTSRKYNFDLNLCTSAAVAAALVWAPANKLSCLFLFLLTVLHHLQDLPIVFLCVFFLSLLSLSTTVLHSTCTFPNNSPQGGLFTKLWLGKNARMDFICVRNKTDTDELN